MPYLAAIALLVALLLCCAVAQAETVVLQQGHLEYQGCQAVTLWGPEVGRGETPGEALALRGAGNHVLVRFDLPKGLASRTLARARLELFIPAVKNLRMICEITARPVTVRWDGAATWTQAAAGNRWTTPGGDLDSATDFCRGRPAGVVDSHSLWEYDGEFFPHKCRSLGVPEGGKWIDFNVTAVTRQWLRDPAGNHGLALVPLDLADTRFPNTAQFDIPGPAASEAARRPRLVLEFEPLPQPYLAGMTHTLERISDLDTRYRYTGPYEGRYRLSMAKDEAEGFQVVLYSLRGEMQDVTFTWGDLRNEKTGAVIPQADVAYYTQYVFPYLHQNGKISDWYFHGKNLATPDPLLPAAPVTVPEQLATPFWFNVRTRPDTPAGEYHGTLTVRAKNAPSRDLTLVVRVWNYTMPTPWDFQTMGQTVWDYVRQVYGEITPELKRTYLDFLMDHRFNPTEQYADRLSPDVEDIPYVQRRGGNTIYLSGNFTGNVESLRERYDQVRKLGLIDQALVYIGDETIDWVEMRRRSDAIRKVCPELMIMIGGSYPRPELEGVIDIFDPQIDEGNNDVYSLSADRMRPLVAQAQAEGEKFFWYVAAGPMLPCPNVQMEEPLIASRVLFWLTWKFGVTGFEYYCYNIWSHNLPVDGKRFPDVPFSPQGWGDTNGDGMLFYPGPAGPVSSVRFESIRDGIEDWESHAVLRDYLDALRKKAAADPKLAEQTAALLRRAESGLEVPDAVAKDFSHWTWEPAVLLAAREELGNTIEALSAYVTEAEAKQARAARRAAEVVRQRAMLAARAKAAR